MQAFDSEECALMEKALLLAYGQVQSLGLANGYDKATIEALISRGIVAAAERGERDEIKLASYGLSYFQANGDTKT